MAQLAFWAAEDLDKAGDDRHLEVVPVGIHYSWRRHNWRALDARLDALEQHLGIPAMEEWADDPDTTRRERLIQIGMNLLKALEQLERLKLTQNRTAQESVPIACMAWPGRSPSPACRRHLQERCRRIEQAAWDRIYREADQLPPRAKLADWAREADLQLTRMRLWSISPA